MHPLLSADAEWGVEPTATKISKPQFLEGIAGKEGVTFFSGGLQFLDEK